MRQYHAAEKIGRSGGYWSFAGESYRDGWAQNPPGSLRRWRPLCPWYQHLFHTIDSAFIFHEVEPDHPIESLNLLQDLPHLKRLEVRGYTQSNNFTPTPPLDLFLKQLSSNPQLAQLDIQGFHVNDEGMEAIGKLTNLESLTSIDFRGTDAGSKHLKNLTSLRKLRFSPLGIPTKSMTHLSELKKLEELEILVVKADVDVGLVALQKMKQLKRLSLSAHLTDKHLQNLSELTNLESLNVSHAQITDEGLAHLKSLTKLTELNLGWNKIQGPGLAHLKSLQQLSALTLDGNVFLGRASVEPLLELKGLQNIAVKGTSISGDDAKRLWQLPKLKSVDFDLPEFQIDQF